MTIRIVYGDASCGFGTSEDYDDEKEGDRDKAIAFIEEQHSAVCHDINNGETCELNITGI